MARIDTVMFTELSRLSRSLNNFLNIFEFAQRHSWDLVCLKTEIDTTFPYQSLVTKILMVFAEFEREITSRRTDSPRAGRSSRPHARTKDENRQLYSSVFSIEAKALWGIMTEPTIFILFLPFFCFLRSFCLRVMSPPYSLAVTSFL